MSSEVFNGTVRQNGESLIVRPVRGQRMIKLTDDAPIQIAVPEQDIPAAASPLGELVGIVVFDANQKPIGVLTDVVLTREQIDVTRFGDEYRQFSPGRATITGTIIMSGFTQAVGGVRRG